MALYTDLLEITNIGTLHFGLTIADLGRVHKSMPWNPLIAQAFYRRGIIETWGRGTLKIQKLMRDAGLPQPDFDITDQSFTIRFFPVGDGYC